MNISTYIVRNKTIYKESSSPIQTIQENQPPEMDNALPSNLMDLRILAVLSLLGLIFFNMFCATYLYFRWKKRRATINNRKRRDNSNTPTYVSHRVGRLSENTYASLRFGSNDNSHSNSYIEPWVGQANLETLSDLFTSQENFIEEKLKELAYKPEQNTD